MRWVITAALFLIIIAAQAAAARHIALFGATPNLLIVLVVQLALILPRLEGAIWAWCLGLGADLHGVTPPGVLALTYALVSLVLARVRSEIFSEHIFTRLLLVVVAAVLQEIALMFSEIIRGHPLEFLLDLRTAALRVAYTALVALGLLPVLRAILRRVYAERRLT